MSESERPVSLDVVIPVFNEEQMVPFLVERLQTVFSSAQLKKHNISSACFIFVDDGSKDKTALMLNEQIKKGLNARVYRFSRNFGHQNAVSAGMLYSTADKVAFIDADLQDPPEVILQMIEKSREGFDVIYGERRKRKESFVKKFCYWAFYRLLAWLSEIDVALDSGDFCLLDRRVVNTILSLPEKLRFPRGLRAWVGYRQTGVAYERPARQAGETKYSFSKLYKLATDGIASLSIRPLKITQAFCIIFGILLLVFGLLSLWKFFGVPQHNELALYFLMGYALTSMCGLMVMFALYVQSAYIGRTYLEVKGRPPFIIMEVIAPHATGQESNRNTL